MKAKLNKILSVVITLCMLAGMLPGVSLTVFATTAEWSYPESTPVAPFESGTGRADDPYIITTAQQLANMAYLVNTDNDVYGDKSYRLGANIDLSDGIWTPIGYFNSREDKMLFSGTFDGIGHTISNLSVSDEIAGLFSYTEYPAVIQNVNLVNADISGINYAGGIVGILEGNVYNCAVSGSVSGETAGGIAGYLSSGGIYNSSNSAEVTATAASSSANAGGITGYMYAGYVINCYNSGTVAASVSGEWQYASSYAGGILGYGRDDSYVQIGNCYNIGTVTAENTAIGTDTKCLAGALAGESPGTITNSYWLEESASAINGDNGTAYYSDSFAGADDVVSYTYDYESTPKEVSLLEALNSYVIDNSLGAERAGMTLGLRAWAEDSADTNGGYPVLEPLHTHDGEVFFPWFSTDILPAIGENFYLVNDVTPSNTWNVPSEGVSLCLNGREIIGTADEASVIYIEETVFNLYDCSDGEGMICASEDYVYGINIYESEATFNMYGGIIRGFYDYGVVSWGGTFNMYGGSVTGNFGYAGVLNYSGAFNMYGGSVTDNIVDYGGVYNPYQDGTVTLSGNISITGNKVWVWDYEVEDYVPGDDRNLVFQSGCLITIGEAGLAEGVKIGVAVVNSSNWPVEWYITGENDTDITAYFKSDLDKYMIINHDNNVVAFVKKPPEPTYISVPDGWEGEGTLSSPWIIDTARDLQDMAACINGNVYTEVGGMAYNTAHYKLGADIDLGGIADWTPIGKYDFDYEMTLSFKGSFDGAGYTISNMTIDRGDETYQYRGLFGHIAKGAVVKNVTLSDVSMVVNWYSGGIAYGSSGIIENCHVISGTIKGTSYIGGIVGSLGEGGIVRNCSNGATVTYPEGAYSSQDLGGIVGYSYSGIIENCYNRGSIIGIGREAGIVAYHAGEAVTRNCYSIGSITKNNSSGSIAGYIDNSSRLKNEIYNCYYLSTDGVGRVYGYNNAGSITNCASFDSAEDTVSYKGGTPEVSISEALNSWVSEQNSSDYLVWKVIEGVNDGYPVLVEPHIHDSITFTELSVTSGELASGNYCLAADITATGSITVSAGKNVNLCLNGKTLDMGNYYIRNYGKLTICDCAEAEGKITSKADYTIYNEYFAPKTTGSDYGVLNIEGGTIESTSISTNSNSIYNDGGTVNVTGGTVTTNKGYGIYNSGKLAMTGGTVASGVYGINNSGTANISGGEVKGIIGIYSYGTLELSGTAQVAGTTSYGICNGANSTLTMTGGTVTSSKNAGILNTTGIAASISGGNVKGATAISNSGTIVLSGTAQVTGTTGEGIFNDIGGKLTMTGGSVKASNNSAVRNCGDFVMEGGTVESTYNNGYGIYNVSSAKAIVKGGTVTALSYAIYDYGEGKIAVDGGNVKSKNSHAIYVGNSSLYLSGNPTIEGCETASLSADIQFITGSIYAHSLVESGIPAAYSGGELTVRVYGPAADMVVINNVDADNMDKFKLVNTSDYDTLILGTGDNADDLVLHAHNYNTAKSDEINHWNECICEEKSDVTAHTITDPDSDCTTDEVCSCEKVIVAKNESHTYTYSASGAVITETCSNTGCTVHTETAKIVAPTGTLVYDGEEKTATVECTDGWKGGKLNISYNDNVNAGTVIATISKGGAHASVNYTIEKATVAEPTINSKIFSGSVQTADVPANALYTITENLGGINVGSYDVILTLEHSENYKWATTDDADVTLGFAIAKAVNEFTTAPAISGWSYGEIPSVPEGASAFGEVVFKYYNSDYSELGTDVPTNAGSYYMKAFVAEGTPLTRTIGTNYDSISSDFIPFAISKANYDMTGISFVNGEFTYDGLSHSLVIGGTLPIGSDGVPVTVSYSGSATNVSDGEQIVTATFATASTNYNVPVPMTATIKINPKDISGAEITLGTGLTYNGELQTQTIEGVVIDGLTVTYDISGNSEINVKSDGDYTLTITGNGNFSGTETKPWNMAKATPVIAANPVTSRIQNGDMLGSYSLSYGVANGVSGTPIEGTFTWETPGKYMRTDGNISEKVIFTPADSINYNNAECNITLTVYKPSYSSVARFTVSFDSNGGSEVSSKTVTRNSKVSRPANPVNKGFVFDGWYTDKALTIKYDFEERVAGSFTLYAKWLETEPAEDKPDENKSAQDTWSPFADVTEGDWFYDDIRTAHLAGLVTGTDADTFSPDGDITRGMFVTVLWRAEGEPDGPDAAFTDVADSEYYAKAVDWAYANGIVMGYFDTEYAPDENITREQMAAILYRYIRYKKDDIPEAEDADITSYTDFNMISQYAIPAIRWACGDGVINGKGDGILDPLGNATRAEAVTMLIRLLYTAE